MNIEHANIQDLLIVKPKTFRDSRGFFCEIWRENVFSEMGIHFVQDGQSRSSMNVLRGLHFQKERPQGQLVWISEGRIFDVCVDIRRSSSTFGQWYGMELNAQEPIQIYMPPGFAHGFCVLSPWATVHYKCTEYYRGNDDFGIRWDDPDLKIPWPVSAPILSEGDKKHNTMKEWLNLNVL